MASNDKCSLNMFIASRVPKEPKDKQETKAKWESEETQWVWWELVIMQITFLINVFEVTLC